MALTDLIYDQRLHLRRHPLPAKVAPQYHFRLRLSNGVHHDVMAANEEDARKHVERLVKRARIVEVIQMTGKA